ncbi:flagellin lysine-N-methylase [Evansella clarkii]|uniref:flagellin lysine-N-methylase n=1 Tax=Evansella clarkii TaxID=79879 RepID=UPI00099613FE|nr:flagellin lysine-N-methylase [Evansella clarkii]
MPIRKLLEPDYLQKFKCLGSECEDTCCHGWRINIDQETYYKHENTDNTLLTKHLKKLDVKSNKENYAVLMLDSELYCPLLNKDKLCKVHTEMGEDYLPNICSTYPRQTNIIDGVYERSATLSCPEAARLILLNPEGITFNEVVEPTDNRHLISININPSKTTPKRGEFVYFNELQQFSISIIKNRSYYLFDRLLILGMFLNEIQRLIDEQTIDEIPNCITHFNLLIDNREILNKKNNVTVSVKKQMKINRHLLDMRIFSGVRDSRYLNCLFEGLKGLKYTGSLINEQSLMEYNKAYHQYFLPFLSEHEYIFENYLVNYIFRNVFPYHITRNVFEEYIVMVIHVSLIKFQSIGLMNYHKESFTHNHLITLIQSYSRNVEHAPTEISRFLDYLKENNYTSLNNLGVLIKH